VREAQASESEKWRMEFAREYLEGLKKCLDALSLEQVAEVIGYLEEAHREGRQVFIIGNGGSAATASHMACDLGKNILPREGRETTRRFRVMALTDNVPWITALANDLGYEHIFAEQLKNLVQEGDLVIVISGSGNSPNIVEGVRVARALGAKVVGILGFDGGKVREIVDACVIVGNENYGYIEDVHMSLDHLFTAYFRTLLAREMAGGKPKVSEMTTPRRIAKNTGALFVAQVLSYLPLFFSMIYIARYLGAADFGVLSFALAFTGIFGGFTDMGLQQLTVREVARDRSLASKYLANISVMKLILASMIFGLIALTINLLGYPEQTVKVVYLIALSVVFGAFTPMFNSIFQAYEKMEYQSLAQILSGVLMLLGVIFAINRGFNVVGFAFLYPLVSIIVLIYSFAILRKEIFNPSLAWSPRSMEIDWRFWKPTIREALPFGLAIILVMIWYRLNAVMLSSMKGDAVVGWYSAAYRIQSILLFIPQAFIAAVYPVMSRFYETSQDSLKLSFEKSFKCLTMLSVPIGVGTTLLAKRFILLIFGAEYMNSVVALQILVWSSVFIFMSIPFGNLFNCLNRQSIVTKITGICFVFNVLLNLALIPKYGLVGASITFVLTEFVSLALSFIWALRIRYGISGKRLTSIIMKVLISSILMGLFVIHFYDLTLPVLIPLAAVFYFAILYMIKGIDETDVSLLQSVFLSRKEDAEQARLKRGEEKCTKYTR